MGVSENGGTPKMDGANNAKPYFLMDDLEGKPTIFGNAHIYIYIHTWHTQVVNDFFYLSRVRTPRVIWMEILATNFEHGEFPPQNGQEAHLTWCIYEEKQIKTWILPPSKTTKNINISFFHLLNFTVNFSPDLQPSSIHHPSKVPSSGGVVNWLGASLMWSMVFWQKDNKSISSPYFRAKFLGRKGGEILEVRSGKMEVWRASFELHFCILSQLKCFKIYPLESFTVL